MEDSKDFKKIKIVFGDFERFKKILIDLKDFLKDLKRSAYRNVKMSAVSIPCLESVPRISSG